MAQKGIYLSNQGPKFGYDKVERQIFNHLLRTPKGATQTELANILNIPRGQIIDRLSKLLSKPYIYNKKTYRVIKTKFIYTVLREKPSTQALEMTATSQQKKDFENRFETEVQNLSQNNILTNSPAEVIDDKIIFCEVTPKKEFDFKSAILNLYNEDITDIAIGEKGICIVLKENPNDVDKLNIIKENILQLHKESLKRRKPSRKRAKKKS